MEGTGDRDGFGELFKAMFGVQAGQKSSGPWTHTFTFTPPRLSRSKRLFNWLLSPWRKWRFKRYFRQVN